MPRRLPLRRWQGRCKAQTAALCRRAARDAENIAGEEYKKVDVKAPQKPFDADEKGGGGDACCAHAAEHMAEQHQKARIPLRRSASRSRFTVHPSFFIHLSISFSVRPLFYFLLHIHIYVKRLDKICALLIVCIHTEPFSAGYGFLWYLPASIVAMGLVYFLGKRGVPLRVLLTVASMSSPIRRLRCSCSSTTARRMRAPPCAMTGRHRILQKRIKICLKGTPLRHIFMVAPGTAPCR